MNNLFKTCKDIASACSCEFSIGTAKELTTYKGGGNAYVLTPDSNEKFVKVYLAFLRQGITPFVLGGGSNTIIADGICSTPLISTARLTGIQIEDDRVYAQCGARISDVMSKLRKHGLGGFEFLSGVPATVGGAVRMNAGAFSQQTADYIDELEVLSVECDEKLYGNIIILTRDDISPKYRKGTKEIVLAVRFRCEHMTSEASSVLSKDYLAIRAKKQPRMPSCGSVFKNGKTPSGKLIEDCALKGTRIGKAEISSLHGNFIVNTGGATAQDFMSLVELCEREVLDKFGVKLEREFVYLE